MSWRRKIVDWLIVPVLDKRNTKIMLSFGNTGYSGFSEITRSPLTDKEKNAIIEQWGGCIPEPKNGFDQHEIYKQLHGFDVNFVPNAYFHPIIAKYLFDDESGRVLSNKNMLWSFLYGIPQPKTIIRNSSGTYFNGQGDIIEYDSALKKVGGFNKNMIIKPTVDSCGGKNVRVVPAEIDSKSLSELLRVYNSDYIIQEKIQQSEEVSKLNTSSLNTIRVNTLYLNNLISVTCMGIRVGKTGSIVDNASSDGVMIGINDDGSLKRYAYDLHGNKYDSFNGVDFSKLIIPNIDKIKALCVECHKRMTQSRMIAWDIALDFNNTPMVVEANVGYRYFYPGIRTVQLCNGPIFGERTKELIDYVRQRQAADKNKKYRISLSLKPR